MKLYDAAWAPSPRKVRIYLAEKGLSVDRVTIDLRADEQLGATYLAINPGGTVPALLLDDGELIDDSVAICLYFERLHPEPALFGRTPAEVARIAARMRAIDEQGYAAVVNVFRNATPQLAGRGLTGKWPDVPQIAALAERGRLMWPRFLDRLEAWLGGSAWVAGDDYSMADIAALVAVDFAKAARLPPAAGRPAIARWHAAASARPSAAA